MKILSKIPVEDAKKIILDKDDVMKLDEDEPIFRVINCDNVEKTDELVDVEIALRKCERTGFFKK